MIKWVFLILKLFIVSSDTLVSREYTISDASYAYKLKRDRGEGPVTSHQELNEIIDNIPALGESHM